MTIAVSQSLHHRLWGRRKIKGSHIDQQIAFGDDHRGNKHQQNNGLLWFSIFCELYPRISLECIFNPNNTLDNLDAEWIVEKGITVCAGVPRDRTKSCLLTSMDVSAHGFGWACVCLCVCMFFVFFVIFVGLSIYRIRIGQFIIKLWPLLLTLSKPGLILGVET